MYQKIIALVLSVLLFFGWCIVNEQEEKQKGDYKITMTILVKGGDGTLGAEAETTMPFIPQKGQYIDLFQVEKVTWSTIRQRIIVDVGTLEHPTQSCKDCLKIFSPKLVWKENIFFPKR